MTVTEALERGRAAYADRRWADAFAELMQADRDAPLAMSDLEKLGRSASLLGDDETAFSILVRVYQLCLAQGEALGAANAAFWYGYRLQSRGETAQAMAWLARAENLVAEHGGDCAQRGYVLLPKIRKALAQADHLAARDIAHEASSIGRRFADSDLCAMALELEGRAMLFLGEIELGLGRFDEAMLTVSEGQSSELVRGLVYCSVIGGCQLVFAADRAREWTAVLETWCRGQPQLGLFTGLCRVHRAELMQLGGAWNDALEEIQNLSADSEHNRIERAGAAYQEGEIHRLRGEYAAADAAYARAAELGGDTQPGLALLRLAQGQTDAAQGGIRRAVAASSGQLRRTRYLSAYVEILLATGALEEAAAMSAELDETVRQFKTPVLVAMAARAVGTVALARGDPARALPRLQDAFGIWQELDAPYLAARLRTEIAVAYEALGDAEGARLEREAARKCFQVLHARPALEALDIADSVTTASLLSRRELDVLRLAASGCTNRQIAAALGLSPRTVDRHVSNILMKLDVPTRAAATAYAYEHGMVGRQAATG